MNAYIELAKLFKQNENVSKIGTVIGIVTLTEPTGDKDEEGNDIFRLLKLTIGNGIEVNEDNWIMTATGELIRESADIMKDDKILVTASEDNNRFYIIDKVVM